MAIGWTGFILLATLSPSDGIPLFEIPIPHFDKVVHFGLFAIHALLIVLSGFSQRYIFVALISGLLLAVVTEVAQAYIPGRNMDLLDGLADIFGSLCGAIFAMIISSILLKK